MGKHKKESRHNYLKGRHKALKQRKNVQELSLEQCQAEDHCSSNEKEPATAEESQERCHDAASYDLSQYRTLGDLPPELQFNPRKDHLYSSFIRYCENKRKSHRLLKTHLDISELVRGTT